MAPAAYRLTLTLFVLLSTCKLFAQTLADPVDSLQTQVDANGILASIFSGKSSKPDAATEQVRNRTYWSVLPSAAYNPSVGFAGRGDLIRRKILWRSFNYNAFGN
ncbi:hypothetical protein ACFJIV_23305 [Mucilaginibacter sp. UC70_90]